MSGSQRGYSMRRRLIVLVAALTVIGAACGNSTSNSSGPTTSGPTGTGAPPSTQSQADLTKNVPNKEIGVTETEILVGGVASKTNALGGVYDQAFVGAQAYFDMINEKGGIYGRKIKVVKNHDDQITNNQSEVKALINEDKVFAVVPVATLVFSGAAELTKANIPTYGWNINPEFTPAPNLFGEKGSYLCFDCATAVQPWVAKQLGAKKVGVLAYGIAEQSKECAKGVVASFKKYPVAEIAYEDSDVAFATTDMSVQVQKMKDAGVDYITSCMDTNGVTTLAKEMKKQNLTATHFLENAYDSAFIAKFGDLFQNSIVRIGSVPFEAATKPAGLTDFATYIAKAKGEQNETSLAGWMAADLFVTGLKAAGPEFTRQKVIDATNKLTWNANGINSGVDWTEAHSKSGTEDCSAFVQIQGNAYVPKFNQGDKSFVCFETQATTLPDTPKAK